MHSSSSSFSILLLLLVLASMSLATPAARPPTHNYAGGKFCLTDSDAQTIVSGFIDMLENTQDEFNVTLAQTLLADDFSDYSDSINYLQRTPLGAVSFASKQDFIDGQGAQPPFPSVRTLTLFHTCDSIAWRWQGNCAPLSIRGINLFLINDRKQIQTVFVELNSGAFLKNVGKPECNASIAYYN